MSAAQKYFCGARAAVPISISYIPVAIVLGAASSKLEFSMFESILMSSVMFSGANQALFLSSMSDGAPLLLTAVICTLASFRHILFGFTLRDRIETNKLQSAAFSHGLTDEVFAVALASAEKNSEKISGFWLLGLSFTALASWILGTAVGSFIGESVHQISNTFFNALRFALPALFLGLVWLSFSRSRVLPMICAGAISAVCIYINLETIAIPAGGLAAFITSRSFRT